MPPPAVALMTDNFRAPPEGVLVNNRFVLKNKLGQGSFGCVFKGISFFAHLINVSLAKDQLTN